jgi:hypothetical protein
MRTPPTPTQTQPAQAEHRLNSPALRTPPILDIPLPSERRDPEPPTAPRARLPLPLPLPLLSPRMTLNKPVVHASGRRHEDVENPFSPYLGSSAFAAGTGWGHLESFDFDPESVSKTRQLPLSVPLPMPMPLHYQASLQSHEDDNNWDEARGCLDPPESR